MDSVDVAEVLVPPKQCPECGRFLKNVFVVSLGDGDQPCPGCGHVLTVSDFASASPLTDPARQRAKPVGSAARPEAPSGGSEPSGKTVSSDTGARDVLDGWDAAGIDERWREDRPPFPQDLAWLAGSAIAGGIVGALASQRKIRGGTLGVVAGAAAAAFARKIWRLDR